MAPLFPRWANPLARAALGCAAALAVGLPAFAMAVVRTPWVTHEGERVHQPIPFDHRHHVRDDGIPCLYCHWNAERSRYAGVPQTTVCMGCHAQIRANSPLLEQVRASAYEGEPIRWRRVHDLPDFVFFDHSSHVHRGVECATCHGDVGGMPAVVRVAPLTMRWCIGCHRDRGAPTSCTTCHR